MSSRGTLRARSVRGAAATQRVLGVDAAGKHGWIGIVIDDDGFVGARTGGLRTILEWAEPVAVVGVDIPVGHVAGGVRRADAEARRFVGAGRAASVFAAPPASALSASSYAAANEELAAAGAPRMSRQAWALVPKMAEADAVASVDPRVHEIHPEVSFTELTGAPMAWSKKSWNGLLARRRALEAAGIVLPDEIADIDGVVADDVVDAAVVAWSARRVANGTAVSLPDPPEQGDGRLVAIWR